ncbi:Cys-tRNA(Pro) deacylase [Bacilli bacterium]|nr:Cys-tRNA(Pro) deacylase [Bacilli bacterium]
MIPEKVKEYLKKYCFDSRIEESNVSFHHVNDAVKFGLNPDQVAKSLLFYDKTIDNNTSKAIMVVMGGMVKVSSGEFKRTFGFKSSMVLPDDVFTLTGFKPGGVCPFGVDNANVKIYLDVSLKKYDLVYAACGSDFCQIKLTPSELESIVPNVM